MKREIVLRKGEVTGHSHRIISDTVEFSDDTLNCKKDEKLIHEEHDTLTIRKKDGYKVGQVQELSHVANEIQKLQD